MNQTDIEQLLGELTTRIALMQKDIDEIKERLDKNAMETYIG